MDLRPGYRERALGDGLECAWVRVAPPGGAPVRVLPDACVDLVWRAGEGAVLAGPDTGPKLVDAAGAVIAGVRFGPGAGGAALGLPLEVVCDARIPLAEIAPELDRELDGDLEPAEAVRRLVAIARRMQAARGGPDGTVREAARRLADPRTRVDTLADELGLSERQLRRCCRAGVGYGPKTLQRVLRLRRFLD